MGKKLFDFCIGNPPYQEENKDNNRQSPVYNLFMEEAFKSADCVELIHPARFLFNAGQTPKEWNQKMLNDEHFKVLHYEGDASKIFANTDIKGGVAITIRNQYKNYGKIDVFTVYNELNNIMRKVLSQSNDNLSSLVYPKSHYGFSEQLYVDYPSLKARLTTGNEYIIDASIFTKMPEIFDLSCNSYIYVHGRLNNERVIQKTNRKYIKIVTGIDKYKVFVTGANGSGHFGEVLSNPFVGRPSEIATQTYMTFGFFETQAEAEFLLKYLKTKFARALLGVLKITQNNPRSVWAKIPLQDFTPSSDIDWSKSIHEIDLQLYRKYGFSEDEIAFIEENVKEMV